MEVERCVPREVRGGWRGLCQDKSGRWGGGVFFAVHRFVVLGGLSRLLRVSLHSMLPQIIILPTVIIFTAVLLSNVSPDLPNLYVDCRCPLSALSVQPTRYTSSALQK